MLDVQNDDLDLDVTAFLPEGVVIASEVEPDDSDVIASETQSGGGDSLAPEIQSGGGDLVAPEIQSGGGDSVAPEIQSGGGDLVASQGQPDGNDQQVSLEDLRQIELDLDAVDAAIAALDAGTYGIDPQTGEPIRDEDLEANPTAVF